MALSATVSCDTKTMLMQSLCLLSKNVIIVEKPPNKYNIRYAVCPKPPDLITIIRPLVHDVILKGVASPRPYISLVHIVNI